MVGVQNQILSIKDTMAIRERFSRKQLKRPDEFVSTTEQILDYCRQNYKALIAVAAVVLAIIGIVWLVIHNRQAEELQMENLLSEMETTLQQATGENPEQVVPRLKEYIDQFDDGLHKQRASLILADAFYQNRQFSEAIDLYTQTLGESETGGLSYELARMGLGYSYEGDKDYKKAAETYKSIIDQGGTMPLFDAYLSLARVYVLDNDEQNAVLILREMLNKFPDHLLIDQVRTKIKKLEKLS